MRVVAFNGSPRKNGNTTILLTTALDQLKKEGIETELYQLAGKNIQGCTACYRCLEKKNARCAVDGDALNQCLEKMPESDGILIGSPTYFSDVSAATRALLERTGFVAQANGCLFKRKVGAGVIAVRRGGAIHALNSINLFLYYHQMINPGSSYWTFGIGREPGDVSSDEEGIRSMVTLGQNMAWVLKKSKE